MVLRSTRVGRANELPYKNLVGEHQKSISSWESKWAAILVGLPKFSPTSQFADPLFWLPTVKGPINSACWSEGTYLGA